jgi:nitrous oxidase accessory protein
MKKPPRRQVLVLVCLFFVPWRLFASEVVFVPPGIYQGDIVINKPTTLIGIGKPVLRGSGKGSVITVLADHCTIRGFVIEHSGKDLQNEDSGILIKSNKNHIENNELGDVLFGIYLYQSRDNVLSKNSITGRPELEQGDRGSGIHLWNSPRNRIEGNVISQARDGLFIQNSPDNIIRDNRIFNLRYGVHYMYSDANRFEGNVFTNNVAGAAIMYSRNIEFRRNLFLHNRGYSSFGILFQECDHCVAEENWIVDNVTGLFAEALRNSTIRRNVISENDVALEMFSSAEGNVVSENNFVQNLSPLQLVGRKTDTEWQHAGHGNFWSDYEGYDLNEDGIGDVANQIQNVFEYMESNHPRLRLYLYSPAASAIAISEKLFPLAEGSNEKDSQPLMHSVKLSLPSELMTAKSKMSFPVAFFSLTATALAGFVFWRQQ